MWGTLLCFNYEDYDLDATHRHILEMKVGQLISNLQVKFGEMYKTKHFLLFAREVIARMW